MSDQRKKSNTRHLSKSQIDQAYPQPLTPQRGRLPQLNQSDSEQLISLGQIPTEAPKMARMK